MSFSSVFALSLVLSSLLTLLQPLSATFIFDNANTEVALKFIERLKFDFEEVLDGIKEKDLSKAGVLVKEDGEEVQIMDNTVGMFIENTFRFGLEHQFNSDNFQVEFLDNGAREAIGARVNSLIADTSFLFRDNGGVIEFVPFDLDNPVIVTAQELADLLVSNNFADDQVFDELATLIQNNEEAVQSSFVNQSKSLKLYSAVAMIDVFLPKSPSVFCVADQQCLAGRNENGNFNNTARRQCFGVDNGFIRNEAEAEIPFCNNFVAFFTLRWLMVTIGLAYGIFILWGIYFYWHLCCPCFRRKGRRDARRSKKADYSPEEQVIINTLATQCASAENLLLQATDMINQARVMGNIKTVEAQREAKIFIQTVEYFQAVCSVMVILCHQYLHKKTFTQGEKFNLQDPASRALQLDVLNYVCGRLQLAFQAESMSEKSLLRTAEAYAILKKVSDALVLVGFSHDQDVEGSLGSLRTPLISLTENAFHLEGLYLAPSHLNQQAQNNLQKVCVTVDDADTRGAAKSSADAFLTNVQRDSKVFDAKFKMTKKDAVGKALSYSQINQGTNGDGSQHFVRTFWPAELSEIQKEAESWLKNDSALENWLERERLEREQKAAPVVKKGGKRRRRRKNKEKYADVDETTTEYTMASGLSVDPSNTYVYNVETLVSAGLGIAGQSGMPFDKVGDKGLKKGRLYSWFERNFPNVAEWPKFYIFVFIIMPILIATPMILKVRRGAEIIDQDGNVNFKARPAGFGFSFLGVPGYYFLDGDVPEIEDLVGLLNDDNAPNTFPEIQTIMSLRDIDVVDANSEIPGLFGQDDRIFIPNDIAARFFTEDFNGKSGRRPDEFLGEIQAGILRQDNQDELAAIRNQQRAQEVTTIFVYALMHNAGYMFGIIPITLVRESLEILARQCPCIRKIYPMALWRDLHMTIGLFGLFYVIAGATVFLVTQLISIGKSTPFAGLAGDPNIRKFFNLTDNVLYIRQLLLPPTPLLLLMKYASRGPPRWMVKYAPGIITKNYWEICYFLHYAVALSAVIMLIIYRPQVFYYMGATWGFIWGGNKIVRILRTRKTTIRQADLISYTVEDKRNNAKKRYDVCRITLNVPSSFPSSSRGQACWLTCPNIDFVAHPFTLAKVPSANDKTIMFHIAVKFLYGDDVIAWARPEQPSTRKLQAAPAETDPDELPSGWKSAVDPESNQTYYYNSVLRRTTWTKPETNRLFDGFRGITTRVSANYLREAISARFGAIGLGNDNTRNKKIYTKGNRATWTQKFAYMAQELQMMQADRRRNEIKNYPVYVSAPLGTSMDDCLVPSIPGSIIITTQNGLPAAESSVRWLLKQKERKRPIFHFFVSISREVNDALSVIETLRESMCQAVLDGNLNIDGVQGEHAHMIGWLGVYIHLTRRKPGQLPGDRAMLMRSLKPPKANITPEQLEIIDTYISNRVQPGRLPFDRFLTRTQQMVAKRTGSGKMAVGYCGSAKVAYALRSACRALKDVKFDGEFI